MRKGAHKCFFLLAFCYIVAVGTSKDSRDGDTTSNGDKSGETEDRICGNICNNFNRQLGNTIPCDSDSKFKFKFACDKKELFQQRIQMKRCKEAWGFVVFRSRTLNQPSLVKNIKKHSKHSYECECRIQPQSDRQTGVSVGVAVGLLFLGIVIGTIATAIICICLPSLHSRVSIIRGKVTRRLHKRKSMEDRYETPKDLDKPVTDNTVPPGTTTITPTAPFSSAGPDQTGYQDLNSVPNVRDSHTYTRLQPDSNESQEPMGEENRGYSAADNANSDNQPIRVTDTDDDAVNHNYFVLEAQNEAVTSNLTEDGRPLSDHKYFVLEEQN